MFLGFVFKYLLQAAQTAVDIANETAVNVVIAVYLLILLDSRSHHWLIVHTSKTVAIIKHVPLELIQG